jgi:osomolarity two-component system, phosphorelay intermediate protein YPD1
MANKQSKTAISELQPPALNDDFLDATTFEQLLEMDDDEEREFSKGIVWNYFEQVKSSFAPIEEGMYEMFPSSVPS